MEDGRYNVILEGISRFRMLRELDVTTPFRQIEAELIEDDAGASLGAVERASFEREARRLPKRRAIRSIGIRSAGSMMSR
jgi:Lon protease-like protein